MANVRWGKKLLAVTVLGCFCAALAVVPAYAFYYVHGDEHTSETDSTGVIEVCSTVDATARGEGVRTEILLVPEGSTAADCLEEAIRSSESQNGIEAIHNYSYSSLGDYLSDKTWTVTVHQAGSQDPGTQVTYDESGSEGQDTPLERFDSVVFTVQ